MAFKKKAVRWNKSRQETDGFKLGMADLPKVRDKEYMAWLHQRIGAGDIRPVTLPSVNVGSMFPVELHHLENPYGKYSGSRKDLDCMVLPFSKSVHEWLEADPSAERNYPMWQLLALAHYYSFCTNKTQLDIKDFTCWVFEKLIEEFFKPEEVVADE